MQGEIFETMKDNTIKQSTLDVGRPYELNTDDAIYELEQSTECGDYNSKEITEKIIDDGDTNDNAIEVQLFENEDDDYNEAKDHESYEMKTKPNNACIDDDDYEKETRTVNIVIITERN